jgi:hypothetical protein
VQSVTKLGGALIGLTWLIAAFGSGAALAWLYRRLHPELDFHKLWAVWTVVVSIAAAAIYFLM